MKWCAQSSKAIESISNSPRCRPPVPGHVYSSQRTAPGRLIAFPACATGLINSDDGVQKRCTKEI